MEPTYPRDYTVSIRNVRDNELYVEDAKVDLPGLVELLDRFIDISAEDWHIFYRNLRDFECERYSVLGSAEFEDPWEVIVVKSPELVFKKPGFWKKTWQVLKW